MFLKMVQLHIRNKETTHEFIFDTNSSIKIKDLIYELVEIYNLRGRVIHLCKVCRMLAQCDESRPPEHSKNRTNSAEELANHAELVATYQSVPNVGVMLSTEILSMLSCTAEEAEAAISYPHLLKPLDFSTIEAVHRKLHDAIVMTSSQNDVIAKFNIGEITGKDPASDYALLEKNFTKLWWAGKDLSLERNL
ncbi:putative protein c21, partial [Cardiosporidium cionae]